MLETLADLHYSYLYEHDATGSEVCLESSKNLVTLSLAVCTLVTTQPAEAALMLQYGSSGEAVVNLQNQLKQAGCLAQDAFSDGFYGKRTLAAVTKLQQQHGLLADGIAGQQTYTALGKGQTCDSDSPGGKLKLGSNGREVQLLQIQLNNWGFPLNGVRLKPTGKFDTATQKALQEFETFFKLEQDGILSLQDSKILWTLRVNALAMFPNNGKTFDTLDGGHQITVQLTNKTISNLIQKLERISQTAQETSREKDFLESWVPSAFPAIGPIFIPTLVIEPDFIPTDKKDKGRKQDIPPFTVEDCDIGYDTNCYPRITSKNEIPAIAYLSDQDWSDFKKTLDDLIELEPKTDSVLALQKMLQSKNQLLREAATYALGEIGESSKVTIPNLIERLRTDESSVVRANAINALSRLASTQTDVTSAIISSLLKKDESFEVKMAAVETLGMINEPSPSVIFAFVKVLLEDGTMSRRVGQKLWEASLVNIGADSVEILVQSLPICCRDYKYTVIHILSTPNAGSLLSDILENSDLATRLKVIQALVDFQDSTSNKYPLLLEALENDSLEVRLAASAVLLSEQRDVEKVILVLSQIAESSNEEYRKEAERLLGEAQLSQQSGYLSPYIKAPDCICGLRVRTLGASLRRRWR